MKNNYFEKEPDYFCKGLCFAFGFIAILNRLWLVFK